MERIIPEKKKKSLIGAATGVRLRNREDKPPVRRDVCESGGGLGGGLF